MLPGLNTQATAQGAFGGSRATQQKADAMEQSTTAATNALIQGNLQARGQSIGQRAGDISAQLQGRGQDVQQNAIFNSALANSTNALSAAQAQQLVPGNTQMGVGGNRTAYDQSLLDADVARWNHDEMKDENLLSTMFGWANGAPRFAAGTGGTEGGDWLDILMGGLQGGHMGNIFAPSPTTTPPYVA